MIHLSQHYKKSEIKDLKEIIAPHDELIVGFNDDQFFMRFNNYIFIEQPEGDFVCTQIESELNASPNIHIKSDKKSKKYWTKDCNKIREFKRYGYRPEG